MWEGFFLLFLLSLAIMPQPTAAGNCINSAHFPTGTVRYVCQGHHRTFISYTAPKTSFGIPWRAKQIKNLTGSFRLHCVCIFFFFNTISQFGRTCNNTINKVLISCSYLIIMRTLHSPHMLIIYYTEVSTLLIQEVTLAPINWIGMVNIPHGAPVHSGGALRREVERDT